MRASCHAGIVARLAPKAARGQPPSAMHITLGEIVVFAAALALVYAGPVILAAALLLLAVPGLRRRTGPRRTAYGLLGTLAVLFAAALPVVLSELGSARRQRAYDARTRTLAAAEVLGGIAFPAGSTVHVSEAGTPEFGTLPEPTTVLGLPLVDAFTLDVEYTDDGSRPGGVSRGTLAGAADIRGIPCGAGPFRQGDGTTRCTLARDHGFAGHHLAAGQPMEVFQASTADPPVLQFGTLARPELLYDIVWPAGTVLGPVKEPPDRMAHGPGPEGEVIHFCIPSGAAVDIGGATLHGFAAYGVLERKRTVSPFCTILPEGTGQRDGYAQAGPDRFTWGERADAGAPWTWTERWEALE